MKNLNHPNWSGKSHRSSSEAFGQQLEYLRAREAVRDSSNDLRWWIIAVVLIFLLASLCLMPFDAQAKSGEHRTQKHERTSKRGYYAEKLHQQDKNRYQAVRKRHNSNTDVSSWYRASPSYRPNPRLSQKRR